MVAEFESDLIRTREGMKVAKAKGRLRGKQPKLNPRQEAQLVGLLQAGEHSTAELGRPVRCRSLHRLPRPATPPGSRPTVTRTSIGAVAAQVANPA